MQSISRNERVDRLGQHIVRAGLFLDLWLYFEEERSRRRILDTMREYNEFFRFTPPPYFISYVIYISGVIDRTKGTIRIEGLIREAKMAGHLNGQYAVDFDELFARAKLLADKVKILRDNAFAHRSAQISYDDAFKLADVTHAELRELTEMALEIANRLLAAIGLPEQCFTPYPREAAEAMMRALAFKTDQ